MRPLAVNRHDWRRTYSEASGPLDWVGWRAQGERGPGRAAFPDRTVVRSAEWDVAMLSPSPQKA